MIIEDNNAKLFRREIEIHSRLQHKNIIHFFGYFHNEKFLYLVLEWAPKGELYSFMKNLPGKKLEERKISIFMKQIIEAF